jgi:hypothetical protein
MVASLLGEIIGNLPGQGDRNFWARTAFGNLPGRRRAAPTPRDGLTSRRRFLEK